MSNKYKEIVDRLQAEIDEETAARVQEADRTPYLVLMGDHNAQFLRALKRKAEKFGFVVKGYMERVGCPMVMDVETHHGIPPCYEENIDSPLRGLTAVAEGVMKVLEQTGMERRDICIVGRGRSVKGMAEKLLERDHTVTVCHSKTSHEALVGHCFDADVVVLGTPKLPEEVIFYNAELIIDIGGAVDSAFAEACQNYLGPRDIGRLCTSILCNRAARWYL